MTTERFTIDDFEQALTDALADTDCDWNCLGYVGGELRYNTIVSSSVEPYYVVAININSSIGKSGVADGTGENSIRMWVVDHEGKPLGSKITRWVTRVAGWERRLAEKLEATIKMAEHIDFCDKCHTLQKVFITKKDGPNKGRLFRKCECSNSFTWLDEYEENDTSLKEIQYAQHYGQLPSSRVDYEQVAQQEIRAVRAHKQEQEQEWRKPAQILCPKCNGPMVKRERRSDGAPFYGCKQFPRCNGTRDGSYIPSSEPPVESVTSQKSFMPSRYQQNIFKWVEDSNTRSFESVLALMVEALAGSGKTTTGVHIFNLLQRADKVVFVAFNKHIMQAMRKKLPRWANVMTCHQLGYAAVRQAFPDCKLDKDNENDDGDVIKKTRLIFNQVVNTNIHGQLYSVVANLVGKVKNTASDTDPDTLMRLAEFYNLEDDIAGNEDLIFNIVATIVARSLEMTSLIDFDDMIWLPVMLDLPMPKYDFIFVDEAQDINKIQEELIFKSAKPGSRIVMVGDRYQSLYGFRGANVDAIPNLIESTGAEVLPLSITYRCAKAIVRAVNDRFPHIPLEAADGAIEGVVRTLHEDRAAAEWHDGDMVLCRTNAPLIGPALNCIRNGIKATIRGRNISTGLIKLIKKMKAVDTADLIAKLWEYEKAEVEKLLLAEKKGQAQMVEDRCETIVAVCDNIGLYQPVQAVIDKIDSIFSDDVEGVVFSSVHRAKGLEADRVYILRPDLMPHPRAGSDWELQQEDNIEYVAMTRAKQELVYVR